MGGYLTSIIPDNAGRPMASMAADDVTAEGLAAHGIDEKMVQTRAAIVGAMHPNLSQETRESYARSLLLREAAGVHLTPDEQAASPVIDSDTHAAATNPYVGPGADAEHGAKLQAATAALATDSPMPDLAKPLDAPVPALARDAWHAAVRYVEGHDDPERGGRQRARSGRCRPWPERCAIPAMAVRPAADDSAAERERVGHDYLDALERQYGDQVLATAAYNGGPGRVDAWLKSIGDPRTGDITHAEWVRRIPIAETRDYVGKVYATAGHPMPEASTVRPDLVTADPAAPPLTAESYVDRYLNGEGRGDSVGDLELQQFAENNGAAIEAEFTRRADLSPSEGWRRRPVAQVASLPRPHRPGLALCQRGNSIRIPTSPRCASACDRIEARCRRRRWRRSSA